MCCKKKTSTHNLFILLRRCSRPKSHPSSIVVSIDRRIPGTPFRHSEQLPCRILLDFLDVEILFPFSAICCLERRKSRKIHDLGLMVFIRIGQCLTRSETAVQAMVTDWKSGLWWENLTVNIFFPITAINNESERGLYKLACMRDGVQSQSVPSGFILQTLALLL